MGSNLDGTPSVLFLRKLVWREYEKGKRILVGAARKVEN